MKVRLFLLFATGLIIGCENEDNLKIDPSTEDQQIITKAYSTNYMYPDGFHYEENLEGSTYYENTVSVRTNQGVWIELNTNDKQQAKDWSEISSSTSAYYRDLVAERETEKFFEFKRVSPVNPEDIILSRVHKSSYFIPAFDKFKRPSRIGTLKVSPIDKESTKEFIEYMWTNYLIGHIDKVLENTIVDYPDQVRYNLKSVSITYGDFGLCDVVEVKNFDFYIAKKSGEVTFESNKVKEIEGACR